MSQQITDFGKGLGYIYVTEPDGTSIIKVFNNTKSGVRESKLYAVQGTATALNRKASATITIDTVTGVGSITSITTVSGTNIIDPAVALAYTGATTTAQLASSIASAINSYEDLASPTETCTAVADSNVVYVYASEEAGSTLNGTSLIVTDTGNMTNTVAPFENGSDNSELYDEAYGYRFFLNADYDASGCTGLGTADPASLTNSWEITSYLVPRSLNSAIQVENATISGGVIYVARESSDLLIYIDTEGFVGADDLDSIRVDGYANGDKITIRGNNAARITTVKDGTGNIELEGGTDFDTGATEVALVLQLKDGTWYELSRTTAALGAMADYRTAGFGFFGVDEFNTATVAASGTTTFNGGTDDKYQKLTGSVTLVGVTTYALGTGTNGDEFWLEYDATVATAGSTITIFGIQLTTDQALNGGLIFRAKYMEGAWYSYVTPNLNNGSTYTFEAATEFYKDDSVTVAKVESNLEHQYKYVNVSFETSEQGDMKLTMPKCTVVSFNAAVSKAIAGTDNATIVPKNHAGTAMTAGTVTLTASSAIGTQFTSTPTGNNTFTEGETMTLTTAKTTAGGKAIVSFRIQLT